ncbi:MAG TPA: class 1 fructose-bisphosphatase, partial [Bacteroidales bacterium]|nr:class 1 fructose-bisphosphatase [Bacteroidales bacterium]
MATQYQPQILNEFILQQQTAFPYAKGDLTRILNHIGVASKYVNREVNAAGLADILGEAGKENIQGEDVKKLDVFANEQLIKILTSSGEVCGIASEENSEIVAYDNTLTREGKYIVCMDPLDGSSNIDVNVSIGTIFSVYRRVTPIGTMPDERDMLQPGTRQVAAGYVIYGSSTMLVYTTGLGVTGFTLDPSIGEYCLSHYQICTPTDGTIYSINEGYFNQFSPGIRKYIDYCRSDNEDKKAYSARYIGSLVSDFHRNLMKGGIYMYPSTARHPQGKLRLLYECNPIAFLAEQAGGS